MEWNNQPYININIYIYIAYLVILSLLHSKDNLLGKTKATQKHIVVYTQRMLTFTSTFSVVTDGNTALLVLRNKICGVVCL